MKHLISYVGLDGHTYVKWITHRDWERLYDPTNGVVKEIRKLAARP